MDSGVDANHPPCTGTSIPLLRSTPTLRTLNLPKCGNATLIDHFGHGTHVAEIVAVEQVADGAKAQTSPSWKVAGCGAGSAPKLPK